MRRLLVLVLVAGCAASEPKTEPALPRPGSRTDDGTGQLARWSRGDLRPPSAYVGCDGQDCYGQEAPIEDLDDAAFGGDGYQGAPQANAVKPIAVEPHTARPLPTEGYTQVTVTRPGAVVGKVTWPSPPKAADTLPGCTGTRANRSLRVVGGAAQRALVYLADISYGKAPSTLGEGGVLEIDGCTFFPAVQLAAPIGTTLQVLNGDALEHEVRLAPVHDVDARVRERVVRLAPDEATELPLTAAGFYQASCEHPAGRGWIVVPRHPYYTLTDNAGRYRLDEVPAGEYTLVAWHEPVMVEVQGGKPRLTAEVVTRTRVKVARGRVTVMDMVLH